MKVTQITQITQIIQCPNTPRRINWKYPTRLEESTGNTQHALKNQ